MWPLSSPFWLLRSPVNCPLTWNSVLLILFRLQHVLMRAAGSPSPPGMDGYLVLPHLLTIELNCSLKEEMGRGRGSQRVDIFVTGTKSSDITLG